MSASARPATVGVCLATLFVSGCGHSGSAGHTTSAHSSSSPSATVCLQDARDDVARFLAVPSSAVAVAVSTGNNSMPQCSFRARAAAAERVDVTANLDSAPQAYFRLERTAIEAGQQFGAVRTVAPPQAVTRLGLEADWFPTEAQLMTTDGVRLITVSVSSRGETPGHERALAEEVARTYLRHPKAGASLAKGFP
jgi:hypothetical protein